METPHLPHHRLIAFTVAKELLLAVVAVEIAAALGATTDSSMQAVNVVAHRLCGMLTRLCR